MSSPSSNNNPHNTTTSSYTSLVRDYYEQKHSREVAKAQPKSNMPVITEADAQGSKFFILWKFIQSLILLALIFN
jgi:hypothetical protein